MYWHLLGATMARGGLKSEKACQDEKMIPMLSVEYYGNHTNKVIIMH